MQRRSVLSLCALALMLTCCAPLPCPSRRGDVPVVECGDCNCECNCGVDPGPEPIRCVLNAPPCPSGSETFDRIASNSEFFFDQTQITSLSIAPLTSSSTFSVCLREMPGSESIFILSADESCTTCSSEDDFSPCMWFNAEGRCPQVEPRFSFIRVTGEAQLRACLVVDANEIE